MKNIVSIGYGRNLFEDGDIERERMLTYTKEVGALHHIVFSLAKHGLAEQVINDTLTLYPTNSKSRFLMVRDAVKIGTRILGKADTKDWIITAQDPFEAGFVGQKLRKRSHVPLNIQEHADVFSAPYWRRESFMNRVRYIFGKRVLKYADCVRVVSTRMVKVMKNIGVDPEKITVLPVRTDVHAFQGREHSSYLQERLPDARTIILTVARFVKQKNLPMLLEAFTHVHKEHPETTLVVVGTGPLENMLKNKAEKLGIRDVVLFLPWADNIPELMHSADIYALSSNYEGWGRVLIEAMASGLPSVTTDVGCAGEAFVHGVHGLVAPIGDVDSFGTALKRLVEDIPFRLQCGENGRRDVQGVFGDKETYAARWARVFEKCRRV